MLQKFAGSVEQGFYGFSYQIGGVCFLFTSAMTPLIIREFSIAFEKHKIQEVARLFNGQLSGSVFIASDKTKLYRDISVFSMLVLFF